ncbi:hypothetical protein HK102_006353, partial [Quaeritorhiza haematococci]
MKNGDGGEEGKREEGENRGLTMEKLVASAEFWNKSRLERDLISKFQSARFAELAMLAQGQVALVRGTGVEGIIHATKKKGSVFMIAVRRRYDDPDDQGIAP